MSAPRHYGPISGVTVGASFPSRSALAAAKVHPPLQSGISGGIDGADSIVVSGGYEDDKDRGDEIIYTGQGGNDPDTGRQVADQEWVRGNAGLVRSQLEGRPVRVVRGAHVGNPFAPASGYRYDGIYYVADSWEELGRRGFRICRFRLVRDDSTPSTWGPTQSTPSPSAPRRQETTIQRIVRNTAVATRVKELHDYSCQVCGIRIETPGGPYAEGAHIRALGAPHNGPDVESNVLCLCPNHHVMFDAGAVSIGDGFRLHGHPGTLRTVGDHQIDQSQLDYHRSHTVRGR